MNEGVDKWPRYALRFVGIASIILAGLGLWYNTTVLRTWFPFDDIPYFLHTLYTMSAICIACHSILLFVGVQLICLKLSWLRLFVRIIVFEVLYFLVIALNFLFVESIAAATIVNGGLMFQFMTVFPIWGPLLANWAKKRMEAGPQKNDVIRFPEERIDKTSDLLWAIIHFWVILFLMHFMLGLLGSVKPDLRPLLDKMMLPVFLLCILNTLAAVRLWRKRRKKRITRRRNDRLARGLCPRCEYNLTGNVSGICPECGEKIGKTD